MRPMIENIARAIRNSGKIGLVCHDNPDGDTLGSALALRLAILQLNKECFCFCQDKVPETLSFLPGSQEILHQFNNEKIDLAIAVDCASIEKIGTCANVLDHAATTAVIDHHGTNPGYGSINTIDSSAPATTLLIFELLNELDVNITRDMAVCLYTGTSTDTGHFAYDETNAETFAMMERLMKCNIPFSEIHRRLYRTRSQAQVRLLGRMLNGIQFMHGGKYTITKVTQEDMSETGALDEDTEGLVNYGVEIAGVEITAMLKEKADGVVKVSLRSFQPYHVDKVAAYFGGGGHECAAGCTMHCSLSEAEEKISAEIDKEIRVRE